MFFTDTATRTVSVYNRNAILIFLICMMQLMIFKYKLPLLPVKHNEMIHLDVLLIQHYVLGLFKTNKSLLISCFEMPKKKLKQLIINMWVFPYH